MLEQAQRRIALQNPSLKVGIEGSGTRLVDPFDAVVANFALHHLGDPERATGEFARVLVPGGRLVVVVNHPTVNKLTDPDADYFATRKFSFEHGILGEGEGWGTVGANR